MSVMVQMTASLSNTVANMGRIVMLLVRHFLIIRINNDASPPGSNSTG